MPWVMESPMKPSRVSSPRCAPTMEGKGISVECAHLPFSRRNAGSRLSVWQGTRAPENVISTHMYSPFFAVKGKGSLAKISPGSTCFSSCPSNVTGTNPSGSALASMPHAVTLPALRE